MAQYVVGLDSSLKRLFVWKTTGDPTTLTTWAAQDFGITIGAEVKSISAVLDGTDIHIATCSGDNGAPDNDGAGSLVFGGFTRYHVFDTTTDTWSTTREFVAFGVSVVSVEQPDSYIACSIGIRSDGDVIVGHNTRGAADIRMEYSRKEGSTWTRGVAITVTGNETVCGAVVMGASDRAHFFYFDNDNDDILHRSLSSGNVLDTEASVDAAVGASVLHPIGRGISYVSGSDTVIKAPYLDADESITSVRIDVSGASPTIATDTAASDNDAEDINSSVVACYAIDGTDTQLLYSGGGASGIDQDIFYDTEADGGAWGTDTEEQDAVTANRLSAGVYERSGTKLGYVWLDGTTTSFDEIALAAPADPIPDRLYKVEQAINRSGTY